MRHLVRCPLPSCDRNAFRYTYLDLQHNNGLRHSKSSAIITDRKHSTRRRHMSGVCIDGLALVLHETHGVSGVLRTLAYSYFLND